MCVAPITIRNPKLDSPHFIAGVDPVTIVVPCGHCEDCKANKRHGVYTRLYYEFKECELVNGYCLNLTLTYAPKFLPHVEIEGKQYPCFHTKDIQRYIKRVRKHFSDLGVECPFTYFCSMELGGHTHRPHYHMLFFVKCRHVCSSYFLHVIKDKWNFGFTAVGKLGAKVLSPQALNYAAKYVAKDAFEDSWYSPLIAQLKEKYKNNKDAFNYYKRALFGRFLASRGLGLFCLSFNDACRLHRMECLLPSNKGIESVPLPQYLDRKLHYNVLYRNRETGYLSETKQKEDDVPTYVLKTEGMTFIKNRWKNKHSFMVNRLKEFSNSFYTSNDLETACYSMTGGSISDLRYLIRSFNLERLAAYEMLYLHRRDYGLAYNDDIEVTEDNFICDFMTLSSCSYRYYIGTEYCDNDFKYLNAPFSHDMNIRAYRYNAACMRKEFLGVDANIFSFISYYLSQCHKNEHDKKVEISKAYVYRKALAGV